MYAYNQACRSPHSLQLRQCSPWTQSSHQRMNTSAMLRRPRPSRHMSNAGTTAAGQQPVEAGRQGAAGLSSTSQGLARADSVSRAGRSGPSFQAQLACCWQAAQCQVSANLPTCCVQKNKTADMQSIEIVSGANMHSLFSCCEQPVTLRDFPDQRS